MDEVIHAALIIVENRYSLWYAIRVLDRLYNVTFPYSNVYTQSRESSADIFEAGNAYPV